MVLQNQFKHWRISASTCVSCTLEVPVNARIECLHCLQPRLRCFALRTASPILIVPAFSLADMISAKVACSTETPRHTSIASSSTVLPINYCDTPLICGSYEQSSRIAQLPMAVYVDDLEWWDAVPATVPEGG